MLLVQVEELAEVVMFVELVAGWLRSGCTAAVLHSALVVAGSRNRQASQASWAGLLQQWLFQTITMKGLSGVFAILNKRVFA